MKRILKSIATILCLCAIVFLAGEWPEDTPRRKVVTFDASAIAVAVACGLYLRKCETHKNTKQ